MSETVSGQFARKVGHGQRPPAQELQTGLGPAELAHAGLRGVIAAMAMTGMRTFTDRVGLVEETPPRRSSASGGADL